jgi:hypothetical protein
MSNNNNVSYLNKTFSDFKSNLVNYAKTYFPSTYNDFSEASPGNMFIEMASYVGDVMSFYVDTQTQENFLIYAKEKENLYALSYAFGYRPKASYASSTVVDIYQLVPSIISGSNINPNYNTYGLIIPENTLLTSNSTGTKFITTEKIDFTDTGSTEITFVNDDYFLFKKSVNTISAEIKTTTFNFTTPQKYQNVSITDTNILQILDVSGSDSNKWYEVPYLAQSSIFNPISNPSYNSDQVPYLLSLQQVPRRFVSRIISDNTLQLEFGAGLTNYDDEVIIPTPDNIQLGLIPGISDLSDNYNKASVFFTRQYGLAPSNVTLQVRYLVGGGITSNVPSNDITIIDTSNVFFKNGNPEDVLSTDVLNSVVSTNPNPSSGGRGGDEVEEIRNNALYSYSSQNRAVTKDDYIIRALSLPPNYGSISKVYITQDFERSIISETISSTKNPLALDLYILAYNSNKQLITSSDTLKNNLVTYLNQYRMVTDAINIKDAFYINIGINFDITILSGYNNQDIITNCITALQNYFNIEKWQINQPIIISDIYSTLLTVKGVQSVVKVEIINKQDDTGVNYSQYGYDISGATRNNNIYPSLDPSIFEIRYPNTDIQGRVVTY